MAFDFHNFLGKLKTTTSFKLAQTDAFHLLGQAIDQHAHDPEALKALAKNLRTEAPAIVAAIHENTDMHTDPPPKGAHD